MLKQQHKEQGIEVNGEESDTTLYEKLQESIYKAPVPWEEDPNLPMAALQGRGKALPGQPSAFFSTDCNHKGST